MALIKWTPMSPMWDPFDEMDSMVDRFTTRGVNAFAPAMDIYQTENDVVAEVPLPGIDPKKVQVTVENDVLTVEGSMKTESEVDDKNYYRKEVRAGSFHRSVALPTSVNGDKAKAEYADGVLKINIPKEERAKPKSIKVNIKKKK